MVQDVTTDEVNRCFQYEREAEALVCLTESNCSSTPKHIANFRLDEANPWVRKGYLGFVVMSKVPGSNLSELWTRDRVPPEIEVHQIQRAFKDALL